MRLASILTAFAGLALALSPAVASATTIVSYEGPFNDNHDVYPGGPSLFGQTFTLATDAEIDSVEVHGLLQSVDDIPVLLVATKANGDPTGPVLASGEIMSNDNEINAVWHVVDFASSVDLSAGTYAIVVGGGDGSFYWDDTVTTGSNPSAYAGGTVITGNTLGTMSTFNPKEDFGFRVDGVGTTGTGAPEPGSLALAAFSIAAAAVRRRRA